MNKQPSNTEGIRRNFTFTSW